MSTEFTCGTEQTTVLIQPSLSSTALNRFLTNSFPSLRSITTISWPVHRYQAVEGPHYPYLHAIAASRAEPSTLQKIVIESEHYKRDCSCCRMIVGMGEEVPGTSRRLPEFLSGLQELTIRLENCHDLWICAGYFHFVLPGLHHALRFESRGPGSPNWEEYIYVPISL